GLAAAAGFGVAHARSAGRPDLSRAAAGMQMVALFLALCVTVLGHAGLAPPGLRTAVFLVAIAAGFAWRARKDQSSAWLHTGLGVLALLPLYVGGVDWER